MIAKYEELEEYMEAIKGETTQPVYLSILRSQDKSNLLSFQIYIQVISSVNTNLVLTFAYDDVPTFQAIPEGAFVAYLGTGESSAIAKKKYEDGLTQTMAKINEEKQKIVEKLKLLGFKKFEKASVM